MTSRKRRRLRRQYNRARRMVGGRLVISLWPRSLYDGLTS